MTTLALEKTWIKFQIQSNNQTKYIFYDTENELIAYHPPFPLSQLSMFIKYYSLNFDEDEFISLLKGIAPSKDTPDSSKTQEPSKKKNFTPSVSPITDEESLKKLISIAKQESIEKVIMLAFKIKFEVNPNYQYSEKEKSKRQSCVIKVKDKIIFEGEEKGNRALARSCVDLYALQQLAPSKFDEIVKYSSQSKKIPIASTGIRPIRQSKDKNQPTNSYVGQKRIRNSSPETYKNSSLKTTPSISHNLTDNHVSANGTALPPHPQSNDIYSKNPIKISTRNINKESKSSESISDSDSVSSSSSCSSSSSIKNRGEENEEIIEILDEEEEESDK